MKKIFVQIASYRDPQLIPTLLDLINKSKQPEGLSIVVNWQHGDDENLQMFKDAGFVHRSLTNDLINGEKLHHFELNGANLTLIDINYKKAQGACWARNKIQQCYDGEDYTLQLDSHHRFIPGWDEELIDMLESLRTNSPKPVLTAYAPSFDPDNDPKGRVNVPWKMNFDRFIPEGAIFFMPEAIEDYQKLEAPIPTRFYSGHFTFADGSFAEEVKHDPDYFFHGEEISIAVRAYTHGYDLYHPHRVILWHEYTRKNRTKIWDDHTTTEKRKGEIELDWLERNNLCHARNRILFGMDGEDPNQIDFGEYGFGTVRTLKDYERYAGISFEQRAVQDATLKGKNPPNDQTGVETDEDWYDSLTRSNDIRICIHKGELGDIEDDYDFFYVGAHDINGNEIYRKDLQEDEIRRHLQHEHIDFQFIFMANAIPYSYTIWTHSKSKGWLTRIVKKI